MARNIWVISDTHFGHENIIKYCNRPFSNVWDMNETMIHNWNTVVKQEDIVYHLGDVGMGGKAADLHDILKRLHGRKRLLLGNHDNGESPVLKLNFQKIRLWRMFREFGILLTHVPVHEGTLNPEKCPVNVHGHIHNHVIPDSRYVNVSVEHTDYTPVNIESLRQW